MKADLKTRDVAEAVDIWSLPAESKKARRQTKLIIGGVVLALIIGYLIFSGLQGSSAYYLTVDELKDEGTSLQGRKVRVSGLVVGDSINWDSENILLEFDLAGESLALHVRYKGVRPDMLREGAEAIVEGQYTGGNLLEADQLLLKCPSKYEEADRQGSS